MNAPPQRAIDAAIAEANRTQPGRCLRSRRGVAAYRQFPIPHVVARGNNHQPPGFECDGSDACKAACAKLCIHAEQAALAREFVGPRWGEPVMLVHVKTVDGHLVTSGGPSCWQCSRMIAADKRVRGIWLFHVSGWRLYDPEEFHELTLLASDPPLPVIRSRR